MIPIIYYAHSMAIYDTPQEVEELRTLERRFPNALIYNPNRTYIQTHRKPMEACLDVIRDQSVTAFAFSVNDAKFLSMGVYAEMAAAKKRRIPIYVIQGGIVRAYKQQPHVIKFDKTLKWAEI